MLNKVLNFTGESINANIKLLRKVISVDNSKLFIY